MFARKPLPLGASQGHVIELNGETLPTPYHVRDGHLLFLGGTASADVATALLAPLNLRPVLDSEGHALAGVWIGNFHEANLGPHREFQISLFATPEPKATTVPAHPYAVFKAMLACPGVVMLCHGLWNDTPRVVAYNRDHLLLDAAPAEARLAGDTSAYAFSFTLPDGSALTEGRITTRSPSAADGWALTRYLGLSRLLKIAFAPHSEITVASTRRDTAMRTLSSRTYSRFRKQRTRRIDAQDSFALNHPRYRDLAFVPQCLQELQGFELVFMPPAPRAK